MFVQGYGHFLRVAAGLRWDEAAIDLDGAAEAWRALERERRERVERLLAGFCLAESEVAAALEPYALAAGDPAVAECFRVQAADEARHARFFDRVAAEVAGVPGHTADERRNALRERLEPEFVELFEVRLAAASRRLATRAETLPSAVGLYHLLLEGVVFLAGQRALLETLEGAPGLAGVSGGVHRVVADERWHIGFGARLLADRGEETLDAAGLATEAAEVAAVWGPAVPEEVRAVVVALHRRRLGAAGLTKIGAPA